MRIYMKQFISGICRICGKDHKDVMRDDTLVRYVELLYDANTTGEEVDISYAMLLKKQRKKYESMNVAAEQLRQNLARVEKCNKMYHLGIGYQWLVTINFDKDVDIKDKIENLLKAN